MFEDEMWISHFLNFFPHLTLALFFSKSFAEQASGTFYIKHISLYKSAFTLIQEQFLIQKQP